MNKTLYTIGYGNNTPEDFTKRLTDAGIAAVLDVRCRGSKSWSGNYGWGAAMKKLVGKPGVGYYVGAGLGNECESLSTYAIWLEDHPERLVESARQIGRSSERTCLLCAERDAYKNGVVNCHRVYIADTLAKILGDEWSVEHL